MLTWFAVACTGYVYLPCRAHFTRIFKLQTIWAHTLPQVLEFNRLCTQLKVTVTIIQTHFKNALGKMFVLNFIVKLSAVNQYRFFFWHCDSSYKAKQF
jgi:hypothetical protein